MKKILILIMVNLLTITRIVGVFFIYTVFKNYGGLAAALVSAICYFTDCLDVILARKLHVASFLGSILDAGADKLFSAANLIVLLAITKYTWFPILCEAGIVGVQAIKFSANGNVQSSKMGKIKTWIISLTVILLYFVCDISKIGFLPDKLINFISGINSDTLYLIILIPLYVFELMALWSYVKTAKVYTKEEKELTKKINVKLIKENNFKDKLVNFYNVWMNNDFYEKYKDKAGYKDILKEVKRRRKAWK